MTVTLWENAAALENSERDARANTTRGGGGGQGAVLSSGDVRGRAPLWLRCFAETIFLDPWGNHWGRSSSTAKPIEFHEEAAPEDPRGHGASIAGDKSKAARARRQLRAKGLADRSSGPLRLASSPEAVSHARPRPAHGRARRAGASLRRTRSS